jgi:drug/metabolite transporter (DMT)-like permease
MVLASLFFALMATSVKLAGDLPTMEKVFFRNIIGFAASSYIIKKSGGSFFGYNKKYLIYRSAFGLLGIFFYFFAIDRLPLANAVVLNQMSPFFVLILSALYLKEKIVRLQAVAIFMALFGVFFVAKPGFNYTVLPAFIALLSAFFAAAAYTIVRHLRHSDRPETIIFYFTGLTTLASLPFMFSGHFVMPTSPQFTSLIAVGITATTAQFLLTHSYRYAEAGDLSIYSYGITVFSIITGIFVFFEIPDLLSFVGVVLILSGAWLNYRAKAGSKSSAVT